ncbi:MAG: TlpA family protein disulfide reductase [Nocardioidaceae bacterium]|nr:TlpA family protein disulfide reductase [Nocardioidaceae bacterium]
MSSSTHLGGPVRSAIVAGVLMGGVLSGCTPKVSDLDDPRVPDGPVDINVAEVELVRLKASAGMLDCPTTDDPSEEQYTPMPQEPLPNVVLPCLGGGRDVDLAQLRGPAIINVWASNCEPCREELPILQQVHEQADTTDLIVLGIDYRDYFPGAALRLLSESGVTFPSVADVNGVTTADLQVVALPQTVFVNRAGSVVAVERREMKSYKMVSGLVDQHLGIELPPPPVDEEP